MSNEYLEWLNSLRREPEGSEDHNHWLLLMFPWLRCSTDENEYKYTWLDEMPEGWRKAFGEEMCFELREIILEVDDLDWEYRILQIKEKFGELRWYDAGTPIKIYDKVREVIKKYTIKSRHTCINCGKPAKWQTTGWIEPLCEGCANAQFNLIKERNSGRLSRFRDANWDNFFVGIDE